jgi:hypothetical protein
MTDRLQYGTTAKLLHWLVVALLLVQYLIGWLMPDIHRDMKPGAAMTFHVSVGMVILLLIVLRLAWRLAHPVVPDSSLAPWQRHPDKSLVDRAGFLKQTAVPVTIKNLEAHDVKIRLMGDFAIIHAATRYTMPDGKQASGRYTDVWARQNGRWLAVSAHVSR